MVEKRSATDSLIEASMLQSQSIRDLRDTIAQSNQQLSDRIDALAVQVGSLTAAISDQKRTLDTGFNRIETAIANQTEAINGHLRVAEANAQTAQQQAENINRLIQTVERLAVRG